MAHVRRGQGQILAVAFQVRYFELCFFRPEAALHLAGRVRMIEPLRQFAPPPPRDFASAFRPPPHPLNSPAKLCGGGQIDEEPTWKGTELEL